MTESTGSGIDTAALEPLFEPWEVPSRHRARTEDGEPTILEGRRSSSIKLVQAIRAHVSEWRDDGYRGASDTTRTLFEHWFQRDHLARTPDGSGFPFSYFFCQREAIETLAYLHEVRDMRRLSQLLAEFHPVSSEDERDAIALGVLPELDRWARYAFKLATGAGKTKVMSLAIVWSYFHALRETDSPMTDTFLVIAPGVTVFDRLVEDFRPRDGGGSVFERDPLIPPAWRGDWNMNVVLQDEAAGERVGGTLYLTNVHRLHESRTRASAGGEFPDWLGPKVTPAAALASAEALRKRVAAHSSVMVLNDEAHHVWDSSSAWNEVLSHLGERTNLVAQLDFSATPKNDKGETFPHVVVDSPLGEVVDAGIVKTPVLGRSRDLARDGEPHENAAWRWGKHLLVGYERWKASCEEWKESGKQPLLFVMAESSEAADEITARLDTDPAFESLNGATLNLHTNLKGKFEGRGAKRRFVDDEKSISDEDLEELRRLSRELDASESPYKAVVSVLMLREGWDVRNVTTIVPLRALSAQNKILAEQVLGRGLRRMTPPGSAGALETVTVIEHPEFASFYDRELSPEGLSIQTGDAERIERTTVSIHVDDRKDLEALDVQVPHLTPGHRTDTRLVEMTSAEVDAAYDALRLDPLRADGVDASRDHIDYEGIALLTGEVVQELRLKAPLLEVPGGAVTYFVSEIETICRIRGAHALLAPRIEEFLARCVFDRKVNVYDDAVVQRLKDDDVRERVRATFVPLVRSKITTSHARVDAGDAESVLDWKPYQVTSSPARPVVKADRTVFNLVPCDSSLERAMAEFLDNAEDVAAFARNAGPQALRIDYLSASGRRAMYTPDFLVRSASGRSFVIETKGRVDLDVPRKARAAQQWCEAATRSGEATWRYVYVPQELFRDMRGSTVHMLDATCEGTLHRLVDELELQQLTLDEQLERIEAKAAPKLRVELIPDDRFAELPDAYQLAITDASELFEFMSERAEPRFAPAFNPLLPVLDAAAVSVIRSCLVPELPTERSAQAAWFDVALTNVPPQRRKHLENTARKLKRLLVHDSPMMPIGLLRDCLDVAADQSRHGGVLDSVADTFARYANSKMPSRVRSVYDFRNTFIAHAEIDRPLDDAQQARAALTTWVETLVGLWAIVTSSRSTRLPQLPTNYQ